MKRRNLILAGILSASVALSPAGAAAAFAEEADTKSSATARTEETASEDTDLKIPDKEDTASSGTVSDPAAAPEEQENSTDETKKERKPMGRRGFHGRRRGMQPPQEGQAQKPETDSDGKTTQPETDADGKETQPETDADGKEIQPETDSDGNKNPPETSGNDFSQPPQNNSGQPWQNSGNQMPQGNNGQIPQNNGQIPQNSSSLPQGQAPSGSTGANAQGGFGGWT